MAKGSVRKKGKKWYYRFYVEDESGNLKQKECVGTESKSETEAMLRKAMEEYKQNHFVAKPENMTVGELLDLWVEEELKPGGLSNGTEMAYIATVGRIKKDSIAERKLKSVTSDHLQKYMDDLTFNRGYSKGYMRSFSAVLRGAFKFAVFPKRLISYDPMPYVTVRYKNDNLNIFEADNAEDGNVLSLEQYNQLLTYLKEKDNPAILPIQIAFYTGLRIGEVCGLMWSDIDFKKQQITVRRSVKYNYQRKCYEIGTTKRSKVRKVDFCNALSDILKAARKEQQTNKLKYGVLYSHNYYNEVTDGKRNYYELKTLNGEQIVPENYNEIQFVCLRQDGCLELPTTVSIVCRTIRKKLKGFENFHFHMLRHTYTSNLLSNGANPKEVQELLGHSDVSTTMNIYAHSTQQAKHESAMLLDKIVS